MNGWVYGEHILPGDGVRARELKEGEKRGAVERESLLGGGKHGYKAGEIGSTGVRRSGTGRGWQVEGRLGERRGGDRFDNGSKWMVWGEGG